MPSLAAALGIAEVEENSELGVYSQLTPILVIKAGSPCWSLPTPERMFLGAQFLTNTAK